MTVHVIALLSEGSQSRHSIEGKSCSTSCWKNTHVPKRGATISHKGLHHRTNTVPTKAECRTDAHWHLQAMEALSALEALVSNSFLLLAVRHLLLVAMHLFVLASCCQHFEVVLIEAMKLLYRCSRSGPWTSWISSESSRGTAALKNSSKV